MLLTRCIHPSQRDVVWVQIVATALRAGTICDTKFSFCTSKAELHVPVTSFITWTLVCTQSLLSCFISTSNSDYMSIDTINCCSLQWGVHFVFREVLAQLHRLCGLVVRVPGCRTEIYCASLKLKLICDRQSVGQFVWVSGPVRYELNLYTLCRRK
jgi:hypothetical protein